MRNFFFSNMLVIAVLTGWESKKQEALPAPGLLRVPGADHGIIVTGMQDTVPYIKFPDISRPPTYSRSNLMITVKANDKIYLIDREIPLATLDSTFKFEIDRLRKNELDTVTVVINADSLATYGTVFNIMRAAKKQGAKVVARIE
jgi:biopolymer transport protein ExbD